MDRKVNEGNITTEQMTICLPDYLKLRKKQKLVKRSEEKKRKQW